MTPLEITAACAISAALGAGLGWLLKPSRREIVIARVPELTVHPNGARERISWSPSQVAELIASRAEERRQHAQREAELLSLIHGEHLAEVTAHQTETRLPWPRRARA